MIQDARGWYTGVTQRHEIGREMGGGFRMGNTCTLMSDSSQCMGKPIQYCKVKSINQSIILERRLKKKKTLSIQKTKIMASGPITSWQIDGETMEIVTDFIFGGSKITADGDCSHEIKRHLLLGRKVMINLDNMLKSRDITNKGLCTQSYGFSSSHVYMLELYYKEN